MYVHIYIHINIHICIYAHIYIYVYTHTHIYYILLLIIPIVITFAALILLFGISIHSITYHVLLSFIFSDLLLWAHLSWNIASTVILGYLWGMDSRIPMDIKICRFSSPLALSIHGFHILGFSQPWIDSGICRCRPHGPGGPLKFPSPRLKVHFFRDDLQLFLPDA